MARIAAEVTCRRTHLFRVDGIPLAGLIPAAHRFLRSERLLVEWVSEQFADYAR